MPLWILKGKIRKKPYRGLRNRNILNASASTRKGKGKGKTQVLLEGGEKRSNSYKGVLVTFEDPTKTIETNPPLPSFRRKSGNPGAHARGKRGTTPIGKSSPHPIRFKRERYGEFMNVTLAGGGVPNHFSAEGCFFLFQGICLLSRKKGTAKTQRKKREAANHLEFIQVA